MDFPRFGGQRTAYLAEPTEPTRRRWAALVPTAPHPGHLPAGRYRIEILADDQRWTPTVTVADGEEARQTPVEVDLTDPTPLRRQQHAA